MRMKDIPWFNRPWTKMRRNGIESLDDAELLALIFKQGTKELNALELANTLLKQHNFHKLHGISVKKLQSLLNDDEIKAFQIKAVAEVCRRHSKLINKGFNTTIETAIDVHRFYRDDLQNKKREHLYVLLLDAKNKVIKSELISVGTLTQSFAHPREVFFAAIKNSAHTVILVHNHPSGDPSPSTHDIKITKKVMRAGELLGIKVLDHVIIGNNSYWSFLEKN
jgi:DNA repair protein RadC